MTTPQGNAAAAAEDTQVNTVSTYLREHPDQWARFSPVSEAKESKREETGPKRLLPL